MLCDPMNCSLPGSSVHGILQARILESVAMPSSKGSSQPKDQNSISLVSCIGKQILGHWATWETRNVMFQFQFSCSALSDSLWPHGLQHTRPRCPSPTPGTYSTSCPESKWCHPTISLSVVPFSSYLHSFPVSGSLQIRQFFTSGGQSTGVSASVLPMNIQDWFPLGLTSLISLQFKGLSRVFSNITVQEHQFFGAQLSLYFKSRIHTRPLE